MVRLPAEYQEVEYLESTGTQWIATEYVSTSDINTYKKVECEYAWTKTQAFDSMLFGYTSKTAIYYEYYMSRNVYAAIGLSRYRSVGNLNNSAGGINVKRHLIMDEENCSIVGGGSASPNEYYSTIDPIPMYIFAWNNNNKGVQYINAGARIYSLKFTEGESIAANFIPCYRKSDNEPGMYDTVSGTFYTNSGSGTFLMGDPVHYDTASLLERRRQILLNTPHIKTVSDSVASFNTGIATDLKGLKVYFSPVQEGTGDPSPDNVRPISGWDGITIETRNENLVNVDNTHVVKYNSQEITVNNGVITSASGTCRISLVCKVEPNTYYKAIITRQQGGTTYFSIKQYDKYPNNYDDYISNVLGGQKKHESNGTYKYTFTTAPNAKYITFEMYKSSGAAVYAYTDFCLRKTGNNEYIEPQSRTITIHFDHTIYGGYVDLLNGEVVEEWVSKDAGTLNWNYQVVSDSYPYGFNYVNVSGKAKGTPNVICEKYPTKNPVYSVDNDKAIFGNAQNFVVYIIDSDYESASDFKTAMSGVKIAHELATPNTYTLTPETIKALKGINNIWSNANGNVEVSFYSH